MAEKESRAVSPWDPFEDIELFRPRAFSRLFEGWPRGVSQAGRFVPAVDVSEDDSRYVVTVEVPGAKKNDVELEIHENVLTIRGEKRSEREEKKERARYVERTFGSFSRSFTLPSNAAANRVSATFENGVLSISIPKVEEAKPKSIAIK